MKKSKVLCRQDGVSLVEVLAVIVIISLIFTLIFSVLTNGQKQHNSQQAKNQSQQNIAYALKVITKEIRENPNNVTVNSSTELTIDGVSYKLNGTDLMKDSTLLVDNIQQFEVVEESNAISIKIVSTAGVEVSTQIVRRS